MSSNPGTVSDELSGFCDLSSTVERRIVAAKIRVRFPRSPDSYPGLKALNLRFATGKA